MAKFDLVFDLKFEISDGKKSGEIWAEDFSACQEGTGNFGENFGANFGANFGDTFRKLRFEFRDFFSEKFVPQKGGVKGNIEKDI